jgi:hypothetical protein
VGSLIVENTYFSFNALESQRSSGYKNSTFALAEIIDNSFDASAVNCKIIFIEKRDLNGKKYIEEILICDDGKGMDDDILQICLQFGGGTNTDLDYVMSNKKIGKFGYGLPNASLSQCTNIEVFSWKNGNKPMKNKLNLEELRRTKSITVPPIEQFEFPNYYSDISAVLQSAHGTIVSWKQFDRLSNTKAETIMRKSEELLGLLYRHLLDAGNKIELISFDRTESNELLKTDSYKVRKNDPTFLMSNTVVAKALYKDSQYQAIDPDKDYSSYLGGFVTSEKKCIATNVKVEDHCGKYFFYWRGKNYEYQIITTRANDKVQKPGIREGGDTETGKFYKKHENECISFVRAGRQIAAGQFGFYNLRDARQRWWSIEVNFEPDADELLGVHNNKQGIDFNFTPKADSDSEIFEENTARLQQAREHFWVKLTKEIEDARKQAWKEILEGHKRFIETGGNGAGGNPPALPGGTPNTIDIIGGTEGERPRQFSDDEKEELFNRLKARYPKVSEDDIRRAIDLYDRSKMRGCVLYDESESEKLWAITNIRDFLIILINTNHQFYHKMMGPLKESGHESSLTALELFISSLAWEEYQNFGTEPHKDIIEEFRSFVGLHLNRYLREFELTDEFIQVEPE